MNATRARTATAFFLTVLFLAGCSSAPEPGSTEAVPLESGAGEGESEDASPGDRSNDGGKAGDGKDRKDGERDGSEGPGTGDPGTGDDGDDGSELTEGSGEDDNSSAAYPAAGSYEYAQNGFEEFCQAARCEREDLPARQPVAIRHEGAAPDAATVISELRASNSRSVKTHTRMDRTRAVVTKVHVKFDYEGYSFDDTYSPQPPVESLRFPLRAGQSWSGRWEDSTSGDYRVRVFESEPVSVGGRTVRAFRVETFTDFRGQFNGRSKIDTWIDPATKAVVKSKGVLNVTSAFGRYSTSFATQLRAGPGY